ncbi:MAG: APC family permease [Candidatus Bathyarchaeia archaeon]|jgi:amino acid transporter
MESRPGKSVYTRDATGLVRELTGWDAFQISVSATAPTLLAVALSFSFVETAYPGADVAGVLFFGFIFSLPLGIIYFYLPRIMPRSGGDYVWISRFLNPVVGFVAAFAFWVANAAVVGTTIYLEASSIIPITLASFGYAYGNSNLISLVTAITTPTSVFVVGLLALAVGCAVTAFGARIFRRLMILFFALLMISTVTCILIIALSSHSDFVNAINNYGGTGISYNGVIASAQKNGWSFVPVTFEATLLSTPLAVFLFAGFNFAAAASGEVRNIRKSMLYGTIIALVFSWLMISAGVIATANVVGYPFIQAAFATTSWPLVVPPWVPLFASMLAHGNLILLVLLSVGWIVDPIWNAAGIFLAITRYVFAFSFDRAFPTFLADVNERFHFPLKATILNFIVAAIFLGLATFTSYVGLFLNISFIDTILWALASIVAVILPFKKRELMKPLPGSGWKIPLLSIVGVISTVLMVLNAYFAATIPAIGPSTVGADAILATIFVVGLVIYGLSYAVNKKHGVDLNLIYSEIPPE